MVVGQTANYLRPHGYLSDIAWLWLVALVVGAVFSWAAVTCARMAVRYREPPPRARAALAWTPLIRRREGSRERGAR